MTEGKLKEQVAKILIEGDENMPYDNSSTWYIDDIHKVLDEAKQDFPKMNDRISMVDYAILMEAWFKKWFGE